MVDWSKRIRRDPEKNPDDGYQSREHLKKVYRIRVEARRHLWSTGSKGILLEAGMDKPYKLLLIEDNENILDALRNFFVRRNYDVVTAADGLEGLKKIESEGDAIDLVITDIVMPKVSGAAIILTLKRKLPDIPIIAMTGFGKHPETLAQESRADVVVEKPVRLQELDKLVSDLLSGNKNEASQVEKRELI
jgi:DNA-binding response OmpR family regulator